MRIETKFGVRDVVWILDGYAIKQAQICGIKITRRWNLQSIEYQFLNNLPSRQECEVFKTKEELIKYISK